MNKVITFNKMIKIQDYFNIEDKVYGEGTYGVIFKGKLKKPHDSKNSDIDYAIKFFKKDENNPALKIDYNSIYRELYLQSGLNHVGILPISYYQILPENIGSTAIVSPFMPNGSLHTLLDNESDNIINPNWNGTKRAISIFGISAAMAYIHQKGIIHRDLKTANILLDSKMEPKICDFGLSKVFDTEIQKSGCQTMRIGTLAYMAPELIIGGGNYGFEIDVFAYSMVLYELLTDFFPYFAQKYDFLKFLNGELRPNLDRKKLPEYFVNLIKKCWASDPKERPTFAQITKEMYDRWDEIFDSKIFGEDVDFDELDDYMQRAIDGLNLPGQ